MNADENLRARLNEALSECQRLREENDSLRNSLGLAKRDVVSSDNSISISPRKTINLTNDSPRQAKLELFRSIFRGRKDIYALRWENKKGASGYSPACRHEWNKLFCQKPALKCSRCKNRDLLPLTDEVILDHLTGKQTVGIYPLLPDETCCFLAIDFDKDSWRQDIAAVLNTCHELSVPAIVERSRSGAGGHLWIFFDQPVTATLARSLGSGLLTRTMERHRFGLDSYDRLFPNQDTMPKGGFGNLIALPLQQDARLRDNSLFINNNFEPHPDQWDVLSSIRKLIIGEAQALVRELAETSGIIGVRKRENDDDEKPWTLPPSKTRPETPIMGPLPPEVRIVSSNLLYIDKTDLPQTLVNCLIRLAAFQNPEFYKTQAMRLSTFGKPRIISCAEDFPKHIGLPRGCMDEIVALLESHNIGIEFMDERFLGTPVRANFRGKLTPKQQKAAQSLLAHEIGVLSAPTAFGKTVLGAWLIAARQTNTLILVHRRQLMDQWRERLASFLNVPIKDIGQIGGGKEKPSTTIDVAVMQSLNRKGRVKDIVANYGQVIVDECHHLPAFSFEGILKEVKARYVVGLTATPIRKDGHDPIITMQCGPIRWQMSATKQAVERPFHHMVYPRTTNFSVLTDSTEIGIQDVYALLTADNERNEMILEDVRTAVKAGRSPLVLTERTEHLEYLASRLEKDIQNVIVLRGGMGTKQRRQVSQRIASITGSEERVIIATGRYAGEGFDDARLDTLFLTIPIAWRGTLQQYAGRLHRLYDSKKVVQIYDYVDELIPVLSRMYKKRLKGYSAMGYSIDDNVHRAP